MAKWYPIATAPRDGTSVFVNLDDDLFIQAHFDGTWWRDDWMNEQIDELTYWMPRPLPPPTEG